MRWGTPAQPLRRAPCGARNMQDGNEPRDARDVIGCGSTVQPDRNRKAALAEIAVRGVYLQNMQKSASYRIVPGGNLSALKGVCERHAER